MFAKDKSLKIIAAIPIIFKLFADNIMTLNKKYSNDYSISIAT